MARVDPVAGEPSAGGCDVGVAFPVEPLAGLDPRHEQAELLERPGELRVDPGAVAQLGQVELVLALADPRRTSAFPLGGGAARGQLLADHPQGQELVALEPQDGLEPLDVLLAEESIAAARALRRQQALVLEITDLRDRDVLELALQPRADGADRVQALVVSPLGCRRAHRRRKVRRYLPIWTSSSSSSSPLSIRRRFTNVPFRLPRSLIVNLSPSRRISACLRETVTSSRKTSQSGERPISVRSPDGKKLSPALPPPERTTSAGPFSGSSPSADPGSSESWSGVKVIVCSSGSSLRRCEP